MSDERLRQLERAAAAGDPEAQARLAAARRRSLDLEAVSELLRDDPEQTLKALLRPLDSDELRRVQECVSREALRREHPPREQIRSRPAMYLGDAFERGLHNMLNEVLASSIQGALRGAVSRIEVTLDGSLATVSDDLPRAVGLLRDDLQLFEGLGKSRYLYELGNLCVANALCTRFDAEVVSALDGTARLSFEAGLPVERNTEVNAPPGTRFTLQPDPTVFRTTLFSFDRVRSRLQELAYLLPGVRISIEDLRAGRRAEFGLRGVIDCVADLCGPEEQATPIFACAGTDIVVDAGGEAQIEAAFSWRQNSSEELIVSYINTRPTRNGGVHVNGLREAVAHVIPTGGARGLTGVVSVLVPQPQFVGSTRDELGNRGVGAAVRAVVEPALRTWLDDHPQAAEALRGR